MSRTLAHSTHGRGIAAHRVLLSVALVWGTLATAIGAQTPAGSGVRTLARRSDLEAAAQSAEQLARSSSDRKIRERKASEASAIRLRLREGDFQPGHRILLSVLEDSALTDTFTVRSDRKLLLPNLPELSLVGVLDGELQDYLTTQIAKYVKSPTVQASALLRMSILGAVGKPGFYALPTDLLVSDAIMLAGGPNSTADLNGSIVRRSTQVVVNKDAMRDAIRQGVTLTDVGLRPGDELYVPDKSTNKWLTIARGAGAATGLLLSVAWLVRRF